MAVCQKVSMAIQIERKRLRLAELLRQYKAEHGLSQRELAKELGLNPTSVGQYLEMTAWPTQENRANIAEMLGLSLKELDAHLEEKPFKPTRSLTQLKADVRALPDADFLEVAEVVFNRMLKQLKS